MNNLMGALLGDLPRRIQEQKAKAAKARAEGTAGGGLVRVVATGANQLESVTISPEAMEDPELLEDMVRAATNEALRGAQQQAAEAMKELTAGLPIPPGLIPGL